MKNGENRLNGSKVTAFFLNPRWRRPPSWISSKCHVVQLSRIIRHWSFILVKYGENRLNGSKVTALFLFPRWRSTAILDFVKRPSGTIFSNNTSLKLYSRQIWWKSGFRFKSYSTFSVIQDGGRRHLGFHKNVILNNFVQRVRHRSFVHIKYGKNRLNGSKVTVLFLLPRWRSPPSWILSKCHVAKFCRIIRHWSFIFVNYGENRLNGSKVIALFLYSRWRSPPSWILLYSRICPLNCFQFVNSN